MRCVSGQREGKNAEEKGAAVGEEQQRGGVRSWGWPQGTGEQGAFVTERKKGNSGCNEEGTLCGQEVVKETAYW